MADADATDARTSRRLGLPVLMLLLAAGAFWFLWGRFHYFTDISPASYTSYFWPRRWGLLAHIAGGLTALTTGLGQIWLGFSGRTARLHRTLGKIYAGAIVVGSIGAFYMALTIPGAIAYSSGLFFLAVAWVITTGMALYAIRRRRIDQHREWMLRSYAVTFAFVTFRLGADVLKPLLNLPPAPVADDVDILMAWASWAVPLLFLEVFIQLRRFGKRAA